MIIASTLIICQLTHDICAAEEQLTLDMVWQLVASNVTDVQNDNPLQKLIQLNEKQKKYSFTKIIKLSDLS